MTEFVRFAGAYEYRDPKTKARTRFPAGWAGEADAEVAAAARKDGALPGGTEETTDANDGADLDAMTKDELLAEAKKRDVDAKPAGSKAEILAAIKA